MTFNPWPLLAHLRRSWRWWVLLLLPILDGLTARGISTWLKLTWPPLHPALTFPAWREEAVRFYPWDRAEVLHPGPAFVLVQAFFAVLAYIQVRAAIRAPHAGDLRTAHMATHGSSRWRKPKELATTLERISLDKPQGAGVVVGSDTTAAWRTRPDVGNPHVQLIGGTRSGKTRSVMFPTVWTLGHEGHSMVLTDPKGELYAMSAAWLRDKGYRVVQLDLLRPTRGNRRNPFAAITQAHEEGDEEKAAALALEFGHILAYPDAGDATDPIWPQSSESLITALALATAYEAPPEARHPATAYRLLRELGDDGGRKLDMYLAGTNAAWDEARKEADARKGPDPGPRPLPLDHPARAAYGVASMSESRTRSSIYTGTAAALRLFADPGVAWLTATSDHDPADAARRPTAIFLLDPDEFEARRPILTLYLSQAYAAMVDVARENGGTTPVPIWFLLDEFGNVGKIPGMATKLTVSAGRGIRFLLAVQSFAQIRKIYGKDDLEVIAGNCDTTLFLRTNDEGTAREISAKVGIFTVQTLSRSSRGLGGPDTANESATGRPLLTPDEILRWPRGESLLLQAGEFPARLPLADLSSWPQASRAFTPAPLAPPVPAPGVTTWLPGTQPDPATDDRAAPPPESPTPLMDAALPTDEPDDDDVWQFPDGS